MRLSTTVLAFALTWGSGLYAIGQHGWTREAGLLSLMLMAGWALMFVVMIVAYEGVSRLRAENKEEA